MSSPLERTFETLAKREDPKATGLLLEAVGRDDGVGVTAAVSVGRHGPLSLKYEVLSRVDRLSPAQKQAIRTHARCFADAAKHALDSREESQRSLGVRWIAAVEDFERFPDLVARLGRTPEAELPALTGAIDHLTNRMFDEAEGRTNGRGDAYALRNARELREAMHRSLVDAVEKIESQPCPGPLIEWSLILADAEGAGVARLINKVPPTHRGELMRALRSGVHPGVMRLPLELLKRAHPFDFVADLWRERDDEPFVHHVLRTFPDKLTDLQQKHAEGIASLPWLGGGPASLEAIPPGYRPGLAKLVTRFGLPEAAKRQTLQWLLKEGDAETRRIASAGFGLIDHEERVEILHKGLEHEESDVRVWATRNLKPQAVPDATRLLIAKLDSGDESVREAARAELAEFNLASAADMLDRNPAAVTPELGALLKKIHPDLLLGLRKELANPIRGRRVAATRLASALGLAEDVESGVVALCEDPDMLVRRTAVEALRAVVSRDSIAAIRRAMADPSGRVREAAQESYRRVAGLARAAAQEVTP